MTDDATHSGIADLNPPLRPGEFALLQGPNGAGKSTLLRRSAGLEPGSPPPRERTVLLLQNPDTQFLCTTVAEEITLPLHRNRVPRAEAEQRGRAALAAVGVADDAWDRPVDTLSMGYRQRILAAMALALRPRLFLADEMLAQLDAAGQRDLLTALKDHLPAEARVLLAEQDHIAPPPGLFDRTYRIEPATPEPAPSNLPVAPALAPVVRCDLHLTGIRVSAPGEGPLIRDLHAHWPAGTRVVIRGPNGCGKSTLLGCLAGARAPDAGRCSVQPKGQAADNAGPDTVGLLLQNPELHLFGRTALEQVQPRRPAHAPSTTLLAVAGLTARAEAPPDTLSYGQQHRLALASVLATRPGVLLLDEPLVGVDTASRRLLLAILDAYAAAGGVVVAATHGPIPDGWGDRQYRIEGRRLIEVPHGTP